MTGYNLTGDPHLVPPRPRLFLVAQYYAALNYAAASARQRGVRRKVYLMPLGGAAGMGCLGL